MPAPDLSDSLFLPEDEAVARLLAEIDWDAARAERVGTAAAEMIRALRGAAKGGTVESFFQTYPLATPEGLALMELAEAFLRIPDSATAQSFLQDKLQGRNWKAAGSGRDWLGLLTGVGLNLTQSLGQGFLGRIGAPVVQKSVTEAMKMLGRQFVIGRDIEEAIKNGRAAASPNGRVSYDMLGEGARSILSKPLPQPCRQSPRSKNRPAGGRACRSSSRLCTRVLPKARRIAVSRL